MQGSSAFVVGKVWGRPWRPFQSGATACSSAPSSIPRSIRSATRYGVRLRPGKKEARRACGTVSPHFEMVSHCYRQHHSERHEGDRWGRREVHVHGAAVSPPPFRSEAFFSVRAFLSAVFINSATSQLPDAATESIHVRPAQLEGGRG